MLALGIAWYGFSIEVHHRFWHNIAGRLEGPMTFRFILQPTMAFIAALADGIRDVKAGHKSFFWTRVDDPEHQHGRLREGAFATSRLALLGLSMDIIYQFKVLDHFYPGRGLRDGDPARRHSVFHFPMVHRRCGALVDGAQICRSGVVRDACRPHQSLIRSTSKKSLA